LAFLSDRPQFEFEAERFVVAVPVGVEPVKAMIVALVNSGAVFAREQNMLIQKIPDIATARGLRLMISVS